MRLAARQASEGTFHVPPAQSVSAAAEFVTGQFEGLQVALRTGRARMKSVRELRLPLTAPGAQIPIARRTSVQLEQRTRKRTQTAGPRSGDLGVVPEPDRSIIRVHFLEH